jgi:hypothetical protein
MPVTLRISLAIKLILALEFLHVITLDMVRINCSLILSTCLLSCYTRPNTLFILSQQNIKNAKTVYKWGNGFQGVVGHGSLQWVLVTVLPVLSFLVVSILAVAMVWQRCGSWIRRKLGESRLQPIRSWRGVYKAVSEDRLVWSWN